MTGCVLWGGEEDRSSAGQGWSGCSIKQGILALAVVVISRFEFASEPYRRSV